MRCLGRGVRQRPPRVGVVGTLTALVLSLLIATASATFNTRNQEITVIAAKVIQLDRLLRRYGPEADSLREWINLGDETAPPSTDGSDFWPAYA